MKSSNNKRRGLLPFFAALLIPLGPSSQWNHYQFKGIDSNSVEFKSDQLLIAVNQSASPLLYTLDQVHEVHSLLVQGKLASPFPKVPHNLTQGQRNADDFVLRVGLIVKGDDRLSWLQRQLAPDWLVEMEKQLPEKWGIEKVLFFTTCRQKALLNRQRSHFLSSRFTEVCVTLLDKASDFQIQVELEQAKNVIGLWLGSDGDDLKNKFQLTIEKIQLNDSKKPL